MPMGMSARRFSTLQHHRHLTANCTDCNKCCAYNAPFCIMIWYVWFRQTVSWDASASPPAM